MSDFNVYAQISTRLSQFETSHMKSNAQFREFAPIVIGLLGMGAYQMVLHVSHPVMIESDLVHGMWFGICLGLELIGLYFLFKNKKPNH